MGQIAIVTGSDSGIGKATAVALAKAGFDVGVTWHADEAGAKGTEREIEQVGRRAEVIAEAVVYLAGRGATYTTGSSFVIDGGLVLMAAVRNQ